MVQKFYRYWGRCTFLPRSDWSCSAGNLLEPIRCITLTFVVTRRLRSSFKRHFARESVERVIYKDRIPEPRIQVKPVCLKSTIALEQMYFQQGWLTLVKLCIWVPRKTNQGHPGWIFLYSAQASFSWPRVDLARLLRRAYSRPFWITSFEFVKVCGIRFSIWESFIGFYICCDSITTILACLFSVGVRRKTPLLDLPWDV